MSMTEIDVEAAQTAHAAEALERLEGHVVRVLEALREARSERDALAEQLTERDARIEELESAIEEERATGGEVERVARQRDDLLHERAALARRVESILGLVEGMQPE
jgi:SMC interacting uncharacterized protein involved in chromosome segregation